MQKSERKLSHPNGCGEPFHTACDMTPEQEAAHRAPTPTEGATAGPWRVHKAGSNLWIHGPEDRVVAFIGGKDTIFTAHTGTPHEANARLIAAAPQMREALRECAVLLEYIGQNKPDVLYSPDGALAKAHAALAAAEERDGA